MVTEAPRIHTAWASGATSAGSPASTATAEPGSTPAFASAPAIRRACSCISPQLRRTGASQGPVTSPRALVSALPYIWSVNVLMPACPSGSEFGLEEGNGVTDGVHFDPVVVEGDDSELGLAGQEELKRAERVESQTVECALGRDLVQGELRVTGDQNAHGGADVGLLG